MYVRIISLIKILTTESQFILILYIPYINILKENRGVFILFYEKGTEF